MASIMLAGFASRAIIPPGYMPATDRPFSFEICWEGFPAAMLAHGGPADAGSSAMDGMDMGSMSHGGHLHTQHHHSGSPSHSEHCVFGTACSAGPISQLPLLSDISSARQLHAFAFVSIARAVRLVHLPQPRAPPGRLS